MLKISINEPNRQAWLKRTLSGLPAGIAMNPNFEKTFDVFFNHGYSARTADKEAHTIEKFDVNEVVMNRKRLTSHNFVFR
jgi:hypothetical protein